MSIHEVDVILIWRERFMTTERMSSRPRVRLRSGSGLVRVMFGSVSGPVRVVALEEEEEGASGHAVRAKYAGY